MSLKRNLLKFGAAAATAVLALTACAGADDGEGEQTKVTNEGGEYRIALSMSFSGNDWQGEAKNLVLAAAQTDPLKEKVAGVDVFVAGTEAQNQISQIQQMIADDYDAIIMYPISPTALNSVIKQGCDAGVVMMAYDASVTEECAHNVTFDQADAGKTTAEELSDLMDNEGNVVLITGVAGTSVDEERTTAAKKVFKERGINVLDQCAGDWAQGPAGECMSRFLAAFDNIDGVWAQVGGVAIPDAFDAAGQDYVPMISEAENQFRLRLVDPEYMKKGLTGASYGAPPYQGSAALKFAVDALEGKELEHVIDIGYDWVTQDEIKVCKTGSPEEMRDGCNTFEEGVVSPGFMADWYHEEYTPNIDLETVISGEVSDN